MSYLIQKYSDPLYKDILWSKPEQKSLAGKLLVIGGNLHAISAPSEAYSLAIKYGIGEVKVILPDKTKKLFGQNVPTDIELVASNPSGSFCLKALDDIYSFISWSDATLFAGDFGKNSETAILLENIALNIKGFQTYTKDAADYFSYTPSTVLQREDTLLVLSFAQLQKYLIRIKWPVPISHSMSIEQLCAQLCLLTTKYQAYVLVQFFTNIIAAVKGEAIVTKIPIEPKAWRLKTAAAASVWWLHNKTEPLKSIATAVTQITW